MILKSFTATEPTLTLAITRKVDSKIFNLSQSQDKCSQVLRRASNKNLLRAERGLRRLLSLSLRSLLLNSTKKSLKIATVKNTPLALQSTLTAEMCSAQKSKLENSKMLLFPIIITLTCLATIASTLLELST